MSPYEILNISESATEREVKAAYRKLAKIYHPDRVHDPELQEIAHQKMLEVNAAYNQIMKRFEKQSKRGESRSNTEPNSANQQRRERDEEKTRKEREEQERRQRAAETARKQAEAEKAQKAREEQERRQRETEHAEARAKAEKARKEREEWAHLERIESEEQEPRLRVATIAFKQAEARAKKAEQKKRRRKTIITAFLVIVSLSFLVFLISNPLRIGFVGEISGISGIIYCIIALGFPCYLLGLFDSIFEKLDFGKKRRESRYQLGNLSHEFGDYIFGGYKWIWVRVEDGKMLLVTDKPVVSKTYNSNSSIAMWEDCTLRQWLNGEFLDKFSAYEQSKIIETAVENDLRDKVFLLSIDDIIKYSDIIYRVLGHYRGRWWLRSPGDYYYEQASRKRNDENDSMFYHGPCNYTLDVCPAIWLKEKPDRAEQKRRRDAMQKK
jgi:curved DNA-binding protein CbpA